ncbi:MAG: hypothetical protein M1368_04580 [Thaumarchaeota archaeon]|nr:hypothetical protein [Nitrososphaerota archaeon]
MKVRSTGAVSSIAIIAISIVLILLLTVVPGVEAASPQGKRSRSLTSTSFITTSTSSLSSSITQTGSTSTQTSTSSSTSTTTSSTSSSSSFVLPGYYGCVDASDESSGFSCSWLSQSAATLKPATNSSIGWSAVFSDASYDNIETTAQLTLEGGLNMLLTSGATCVRIDIGYDSWLTSNITAQTELENYSSQISLAGKCLVIADAAAETFRSSPLNWSQFQTEWVQRVQTLAGIFKPSYYIVIKEPGWYVPMVSDATTNPQFQNVTVWVQLASNLANAVHSVSPNTQVGVSIGGGIPSSEQSFYVYFLQGVSQLSSISFIGYDQYCANDWKLDLNLESQVQTSKAIWIAEAWSTTNSSVVFNSDRASLDAYWIQVLYYYGLYLHASVIEPFYTDAFASYTKPTDFSQRTFLFYWFQHLATTYGQPISS